MDINCTFTELRLQAKHRFFEKLDDFMAAHPPEDADLSDVETSIAYMNTPHWQEYLRIFMEHLEDLYTIDVREAQWTGPPLLRAFSSFVPPLDRELTLAAVRRHTRPHKRAATSSTTRVEKRPRMSSSLSLVMPKSLPGLVDGHPKVKYNLWTAADTLSRKFKLSLQSRATSSP
ncbi:hypothetical protein BC940DRAFT_298640 [Gongronella butleri]|nr:hypothetical protein BC940DRAFT_298640 [Gongronella butleri]